MMMMLDAAPSTADVGAGNGVAGTSTGVNVSGPGSGRKRVKGYRGGAPLAGLGGNVLAQQALNQNQGHGMDAMDVEEDGGRERKRVARR